MYSKIKHIALIILFTLPIVFLTNCNSSRKIAKSDTYDKKTDENFDKFYNKFHSDSIFQVSRTKFPIEGMFVDSNNEKEWTKDNLPLMKTRIYDVDTTLYQVAFDKTKTSFIQKIWLEASGFSSECRFELIRKKWYLVYVLDKNF